MKDQFKDLWRRLLTGNQCGVQTQSSRVGAGCLEGVQLARSVQLDSCQPLFGSGCVFGPPFLSTSTLVYFIIIHHNLSSDLFPSIYCQFVCVWCLVFGVYLS